MKTLLSNPSAKIIFPAFIILYILSCQKEINNEGNIGIQPDFTTKVNSSVSGFVTDENDDAVLGATVNFGTSTTSTDKYGFFEIRNVNVVKITGVVTVIRPGYFPGIKTFLAENTKSAFFRIKLLPKINVGSINATTGGNVTLSNGLAISFPAGSIMNTTTSAPYAGFVNVAAHWINPVVTDLGIIMPGDLRGIQTNGSLKTLTTYGMIAVELTSTSGELLQLATGKKATITMPIPASILSASPSVIPLSYFDKVMGLWIEESQAIKTGNTYVGEVSHFSFWNGNVPENYVQLSCTIQDATGNPVRNAGVMISEVINPHNSRYTHTDTSGYINVAISANTQLLLEIYSEYNCHNLVYIQTFNTTSVNLSLGIINLPASSTGYAVISGTATNCINSPISDGFIIMHKNKQYSRHLINNNGSFNFGAFLCNNGVNAFFIAEDLVTSQQGSLLNYTLNTGANFLGNLQACGTNTQEFLTYTINGGAPVNFITPPDSITQTNGSTPGLYFFGANIYSTDFVNFNLSSGGISTGSMQNLIDFTSSQINTQTTLPSPITVNITEYGSVGQFISGNFSGVIRDIVPPNTTYNIVCNFRVRRNF